ncbi:uncharacterized mitochondrial protein AtMg00810-like [Telopea speciosissima]|uniref:uncharacterized mitochondrial protein AtMg00810-like n=1 Tax=Telopea speciosissima TaxID=54955 RepID=UPI001CC5905F|nr:uncharacterized mitochondrial protein AtMg00810-like [Telopea speciosissima]
MASRNHHVRGMESSVRRLSNLGSEEENDSLIFVKTSDNGIVVVLVYVDNIVITGNNLSRINTLKYHLSKAFDIKDLGKLRYFLGIEIASSQKGLFLSQRKYVLDLLRETGKLGVKPGSVPMDYSSKFTTNDTLLQDQVSLVVIYLTITRPDIAFAVSYVSQFMQAPTEGHMELVEHILQYLKSSPGRGILMQKNGHTKIEGYTDADCASNPTDRRSTTGLCTFVGGNIVTWKSKKQNVVARSSVEAKYRAMASAASEIVWLRLLLKELGCDSSSCPTNLFCDNQRTTRIASNPVFHERTKRIEVYNHFVRENVQDKTIETPYVRSEDKLADIFTKASQKGSFQDMINKLTFDDIFAPT